MSTRPQDRNVRHTRESIDEFTFHFLMNILIGNQFILLMHSLSFNRPISLSDLIKATKAALKLSTLAWKILRLTGTLTNAVHKSAFSNGRFVYIPSMHQFG